MSIFRVFIFFFFSYLLLSNYSMWMLYFVNGLNNNLTSNLSAYIISDFSEHSLLTVISVVTSVMGAACVMPIAKVLNLWDRTLGISIMVLIAIMGLIMMAGCNNITTYCAAQVNPPARIFHSGSPHVEILII